MDWTKIQELQELGIEKILKDKNKKSLYVTIYKNLFQTNLCGTCNSAIKHSFIQFKTLNQTTLKIMEARKFLFKENTVIWVPNLGMHITNSNLTDATALTLLRRNKGYIKYMATFPQDWLSMISPVSSPVAKGPKAAAPAQPATVAPINDAAKLKVREAITESLNEMTNAELKEYAKERAASYPEWAKHKSKVKLLEYILGLL